MKSAAILRSLFPSHKQKRLIHKVDIHSHLIPGIDDGVKSIKESLELLKAFKNAGVNKVITTPHIMSDYCPNTPEIINEQLTILKKAVAEENIDIDIEAAAEYYLDEAFIKNLQDDTQNMLTFGDKYILFETSFTVKPIGLEEMIFQMKSKCLQPVLAHPERYLYLLDDWDFVLRLKELGTLFQLNINSLGDFYGKGSRKLAEKMIDHRLIDFVGSDCHSMRHFEAMLKTISKSRYWDRLMALPLINDHL